MKKSGAGLRSITCHRHILEWRTEAKFSCRGVNMCVGNLAGGVVSNGGFESCRWERFDNIVKVQLSPKACSGDAANQPVNRNIK